MKAEKQLIERNLKFSHKYQYQGITRGSIESCQFTSCDNCGKLITNMVNVIQKETGKHFTIGTDCADTLIKANCMYNGLSGREALDYHMDIYSFNKCSKVATELNKGKKFDIDFVWVKVENDKGKFIDASLADMKKFYPELIMHNQISNN